MVMTRILIGLPLLLGLCASAFAQPSSIDIEDAPTFAAGSVIEIQEFIGIGDEQFPDKAVYTNSVAAPGTNYSVNWELKKTHGYNRITGQLYLLGSPMGVISQSHGHFSGTRTVEFMPAFWTWFAGRSVDEERYGTFILTCQYRPGPGTTWTGPITFVTFRLRPQDYNSASGWGTSNSNGSNNTGGSGGGSGAGDTESFWESLFVPDEESLVEVQNALDNLLGWGPLGLITGRSSLFPTPAGYETGHFDEDLKVAINVGGGGTAAAGVGYGAMGTYYLDLGPFSAVVTFLRTVILVICYWFFLSKMWSAVGRVLGLNVGGILHVSTGEGENSSGNNGDVAAANGKMHGAIRSARTRNQYPGFDI